MALGGESALGQREGSDELAWRARCQVAEKTERARINQRLTRRFATTQCTRKFPAIDFVRKFGGREGFIPLPEVHELKRFSNIPEYPYLRKYPSISCRFEELLSPICPAILHSIGKPTN